MFILYIILDNFATEYFEIRNSPKKLARYHEFLMDIVNRKS